MEEERWKKRDGRREMEEERWKKRDGRREMEEERWKKRDGRREMEEERWKKMGDDSLANLIDGGSVVDEKEGGVLV
jgi:hypothetical protein